MGIAQRRTVPGVASATDQAAEGPGCEGWLLHGPCCAKDHGLVRVCRVIILFLVENFFFLFFSFLFFSLLLMIGCSELISQYLETKGQPPDVAKVFRVILLLLFLSLAFVWSLPPTDCMCHVCLTIILLDYLDQAIFL